MPGRELGVLGNRITFRTPRAWGRERKAAGPSTLGHPPARAPFTSSSTSPRGTRSRAYRRRVVDLPQHGLVPLSIRNCAAPTPRPTCSSRTRGPANDSTRAASRRRGIRHTVPERIDRVARRAREGSNGGRPPAFDPRVHRRRTAVERCFDRLEHRPDLSTGFTERSAICWLACSPRATMIRRT